MASAFSVLLAEDSPVNQEVGRAMLETLGYRVEVASNGLEAFRLFQSNRYDLVFMDCQMPEMNGWEATEKIRESEQGRARRTPIIAMTAYMLDEEIQKCRAAGMDDHLCKPFSLRELSEMLNRWIARDTKEDAPEIGAVEPAPGPGPVEAKTRRPCLDPETLNNLRLVLGLAAADTIPTVIKIYLSDSPLLLEKLNGSFEAGDSDAMGRAAHSLKSSSANLGANVLAGLCREIEEAARSQSIEGAEGLVRRIEAEYRMVEQALRAVLDKKGG